MALDHAWTTDTGARRIPGEDDSWDHWVPATATRNWLLQDPILDWVDLFGKHRGLVREIADYNEVECRVMAEILAWLRANR